MKMYHKFYYLYFDNKVKKYIDTFSLINLIWYNQNKIKEFLNIWKKTAVVYNDRKLITVINNCDFDKKLNLLKKKDLKVRFSQKIEVIKRKSTQKSKVKL
jgi:hypothetical protein